MLRKPALLLVILMLLAGACTKEQDVAPTDDNEAITTVTLTLTNKTNRSDVVTAIIEGLDKTPDFSKAKLTLKTNTTYSGVITLLDKTKTPALDVSAGVKEEANEHLFIYTPAAGLVLTVTITDKDTNPSPGPYPVGLTTDMTTTGASTGKLNVVLRHQPNVKNGTIPPGSTDLDTAFDVVVQ